MFLINGFKMSIDVMSDVVESLIFPPGLIISLIFISTLFAFIRLRKIAKFLAFFAWMTLWIASMPAVAYRLIDTLQKPYPQLTPYNMPKAHAIVVLGGGMKPSHKGYNLPPELSPTSMQRMDEAVDLYEKTRAPLLLTGGMPSIANYKYAEANVMYRQIKKSYGVKPKWVETKSANTYTNAMHSAEILKQNKINKIYLVTSAWHMKRAIESFKHFGISAVPAPSDFVLSWSRNPILDFLPSSRALRTTSIALHEYVGMLWYRWHYGLKA